MAAIRPITIITMNASGKHQPDLLDVATKRKEAIRTLLNGERPHLILFQNFIPDQDFQEEFQNYKNIGESPKSASQFYDTLSLFCPLSLYFKNGQKKIKSKGMFVNGEFAEIMYSVSEYITGCPVIAKHRFCISQMANLRRDPKLPPAFVCISWHGPYTQAKLNEKKELLEGLLQILDNWFKKYNIPVIMGGDFNLSYKKAKKLMYFSNKAHSLAILKSGRDDSTFYVMNISFIFMAHVQTIEKTTFIVNINEHCIFNHSPARLNIIDNTIDIGSIDGIEECFSRMFRPKKRNGLFLVTCPKNIGSVGRFFCFFVFFFVFLFFFPGSQHLLICHVTHR
ncbi:uncharacterized protein LOC128237264 [Mya arenaria]|nr:uncharacterized protein LOC128237264 [Mya arenaria]